MIDHALSDIRDGEWHLLGYDAPLKRSRWIRYEVVGDEIKYTIRATYDAEPTVMLNKHRVAETEGKRFGDYQHIASIAPNVYWSELHEAQQQEDQTYLKRWFNNSDNRAWRASRGSV
jgi:hypothetical protein